jgi:hypothetical protein
MMDFMQYGVLPSDYGFGASRSGSGGGSGDAKLSLATLQTIEKKQKAYVDKRFDLAWGTTMFTEARKAADAEYSRASNDLVTVRALVARAKKDKHSGVAAVRVSDLPKAVRTRFASLLPRAGSGGGTTGGGTTGGGKGGGTGTGLLAPLVAQEGAPPVTPLNMQAAGQGAGTGTGTGTGTEIIAGVSNTTLLLLGGGALLAFVLVRRKGDKSAKVFKGT